MKTTAPKLAVDQVYELEGGILKASSGGDFPKDLQQAYDLKRENRKYPVYSSCGTRCHTLLRLSQNYSAVHTA